ncbi:SMI1/KNR4 family protein [Streptomyces bambusae]|uniref:SMI1/KNR4 family protein n=1 Tax=Streptomyces bambusae TaxID=1550616 RepID=A0ABS6ZBS7_9ACTN|nr:SMI1/KNR4 family protein [Streptomyces bambusae]MBW5485219.1 SMI1/KNR4 family protein [Streptomyces bambusae]
MHPDVKQLTQLVPPSTRRSPRAWPGVEARLGTALPEDFRDLVDMYGGGVFDETIWVLEPDCADPDYDLLAMKDERAEVLAGLWEIGEPRPEQLAAEGTGLLPFAYIEGSGAYLYWLTDTGTRPEDWTVLANAGRGPEWEHHPMNGTRFILSVLTGATRSGILAIPPTGDHTFDSNSDIFEG